MRPTGIGGRKIELIFQEETTPKETIDRYRKLVLQDKVDAVHGIISSAVSLALAPAAEQSKMLTMLWDGTTQDGVKEMMPNPQYVFRSIDNEVDAVMASLLAIRHFKGKFARIAGINPDYTVVTPGQHLPRFSRSSVLSTPSLPSNG
jgi:branched-chain amino acid transport system substrate-binding protein